MNEKILTPEQVDFFKLNGYVILKNFIEVETIENWRDQIWQHLKADLSDPNGWPNSYVIDGFKVEPENQIFGQFLFLLERMWRFPKVHKEY